MLTVRYLTTVLLQRPTVMWLQKEVLLLEPHFRNSTVEVLLRQVEAKEVLLRLPIHLLLKTSRTQRIPVEG